MVNGDILMKVEIMNQIHLLIMMMIENHRENINNQENINEDQNDIIDSFIYNITKYITKK
jgi:hypothetical protein